MNELNTQQIVLLCLLVSFVSSIATGITTVSLLEQSPEPVSQTINRVVEKTIERVVEPTQNGEEPVERIVETVVVNQEDLTVEAVEKNSRSLVRLYNKEGFNDPAFIGLGIVVGATGRVITENTVGGSGKITGSFASGDFELKLVRTSGSFNLYEVTNAAGATFVPASLADSQNLKLAQTVILLSGRQNNIVSTGIINDLSVLGGETEAKNTITSINAGVDVSKILIGSMLLNLQGEIVGVKMGSGSSETSLFTPVNVLSAFLSGAGN